MPLHAELKNTQRLTLSLNGGRITPITSTGAQGLPGPGAAAWTALQAVTTGSVRQAPDGSWIKSAGNRTTRASFDATEETFWTAVLGTSGTLEADALSASFARRPAHVFYPERYGAVGDGVTDDTDAFLAMHAIAAGLIVLGVNHFIFDCNAAVYLFEGEPIHPDGAGGAHAVLPMPHIAFASDRVTFEYRGVASTLTGPFVTLQDSGTVFNFTAEGGYDATYGLASCIGGPAWRSSGTHNFFTGAGSTNLAVVLDGITVRRPNNPTIAGADFSWCQAAQVKNIVFDLNCATADITYPTHPTNLALLMPEVNNNVNNACEGKIIVIGAYGCVRYAEHFQANHLWFTYSRVGVMAAPGVHANAITHINYDGVEKKFAEVDPEDGIVNALGSSYTTVLLLDIGDSPEGEQWNDPPDIDAGMSGSLHLTAGYFKNVAEDGVGQDMTYGGTYGDLTYDLTNLADNQGWKAWTPSSANFSWGGSGTSYARYKARRGNTVDVKTSFRSGGAVLGTIKVSLPVPIVADALDPAIEPIIGEAMGYDVSTSTKYSGQVFIDSSTGNLYIMSDGAGPPVWNATTPFTWAALDYLRIKLNYERA